MGKIQVLSFEVANLIAAGEVVDRPASAIKEMMENSIDAGAKHITVEIQHGGVSLMRVTDDGCGMSAEDLPMAIRRHATSKIRDARDLDGIATLGFRGEALAAISAVSDMRIISKREEDEMGAMLEVRGGAFCGISEHGCRNGTTIIVENLFYNVPARRKFLKRDATESMAVSANVERVALSHPEIAVRLIVDGVSKLETAGDGNLKSAIYAVFGKEFASRLIPVSGDYENIKISGFIGRPDHVKVNRNYQNFFINQRYVRSKTAMAAIEQAYVSFCAPEKYPCCVIFIELNPQRVDVNVHPAKLEVKFSNEKPVFEAIYYSVRQALEENTQRPEMHSPTGTRYSDATESVEERVESVQKRQLTMTVDTPSISTPKPPQQRMTAEEYRTQMMGKRPSSSVQKPTTTPVVTNPVPVPQPPAHFAEEIPMEVLEAEATRFTSTPSASQAPTESQGEQKKPLSKFVEVAYFEGGKLISGSFDMTQPVTEDEVMEEEREDYEAYLREQATQEQAELNTQPVPTEMPHVAEEVKEIISPQEPILPWRIVGEVFNSYVLVEQGDRMLIIDKHAAHERIIFEQLKANLSRKGTESQMLMFPVEVMLMSDEVGLLDTYREELEAIGFSFSCMRNTVKVDMIPADVDISAVPDMFATFAEQLKDGTGVAKLTRDIAFEKALYQASCKAAIKAGRVYPPEHIEWLVKKLMELPDITCCPHGRPVAMEMTKRHIDHQFERC